MFLFGDLIAVITSQSSTKATCWVYNYLTGVNVLVAPGDTVATIPGRSIFTLIEVNDLAIYDLEAETAQLFGLNKEVSATISNLPSRE